jgi:GNAT superfamily N-acetyltransferase
VRSAAVELAAGALAAVGDGPRLSGDVRFEPGSLSIREARPDEAEALAAIQREASVAALAHIFPPERFPFPIDEVRERWRDAVADPELAVLVAERGGALVGVAGCRAEWLDGLYVLPASWGEGVGRELHDDVLERLRAAGSARCHLWVLEHNDRARRFYERLGWRQNGDTRVVPFPPNPTDLGYSIEL